MPEPLSPLFEELYLSEGLQDGVSHLFASIGISADLLDFLRAWPNATG